MALLRKRKYPDDYKPDGMLSNAQMRGGHDSYYSKWADESLVWIVKTKAGAEGQGAPAELARRHAESMRKSSLAAWWLAFAMAVLAVIQVVLLITT